MTKHKTQVKSKQESKKWVIVGLGIVVLVVVAAALVLTRAPSPSAAESQKISPQEYQAQFVEAARPHALIDVRTPEEFATGYIAGAANIPLQELTSRLGEVPTDQPVVLYCRSGNRSAQAAEVLREAGYSQIYDLGGVNTWTAAGLPLQ